jgi:NADPH:quinone reductase-like Zn-dependent oxidoreductase
MSDWHFLVDRADYRTTKVVEFEPPELTDGEVRVRVDAFGFTANNVTYAAAGDMIGYWTFFPAPDLGDDANWGRVPVWGFGEVVESRSELVPDGERLFGYFPMSTELVMTPTHVTAASLTDGAEHRAALPPVYNRYVRCAADPGYDPDLEAEQALYRPLFFTAFLIDDFLADNDFFGASTVVLASASSKTAFGTAHLLHRRDGITVVGLTSPGNVAFVEGLGCYDHVLAYDDAALLPDGPAALVDMSGNPAVVRSVHERYGDDLRHSMIVGLTHWEDRVGSTEPMPGPPQSMFFAPTRIEKRHADWGAGVVEAKLAEQWGPFIRKVSDWVSIEHASGPDGVADVYVETLEGNTSPDVARMLHP